MKNPLFARYLRDRATEGRRRTQSAIARVFTIERCRGFRFSPSAAFSPVTPRIIGVARKAETPGRLTV